MSPTWTSSLFSFTFIRPDSVMRWESDEEGTIRLHGRRPFRGHGSVPGYSLGLNWLDQLSTPWHDCQPHGQTNHQSCYRFPEALSRWRVWIGMTYLRRSLLALLFCALVVPLSGDYRNPVLFADYSDPDVIREGGDFYLVSSSFSSVPGLPVLHSRDL